MDLSRSGPRPGKSLAATLLIAAALIVTTSLVAPSGVARGQPPNRPDRGRTNFDKRLDAARATAIARRNEKIASYLKRFATERANASLKSAGVWQVSFYEHNTEVAQVLIDDASGAVTEAWTGPQVAWTMARGVRGAFGRKVTEPWVWVPLMVLFVVPFVDPKRPFKWLHLDLLALLGFTVSHYFFNRGEIFTSVPLVYPVLAYLLLRMLAVGFRAGRAGAPEISPPKLLVPTKWLLFALIFLVGFRVGLNVIDSNVIDVGYSGAIGADRITHGADLYGNFPSDNPSGDTYGPANYLAYVPFESALPWHGKWDDLPAAHGAAIAFDLAMVVLLLLAGRRLMAGAGGRKLGVALAYAWVTFPYTIFVSNSNANDSLVAVLLMLGFLALTSAPLRGAFLALAAATKFAPLALVPLWGSFPRLWSRAREKLLFALAFVAVVAAVTLPFLLDTGVHSFWDRTVAFQLDRDSPFSIWGQHPIRYATLHDVVKVATVALAAVVAFLPRQKNAVQLAALSAAILIALQIGIAHWFYLYIVWFFPLVMIALLARGREPDRPDGFDGRR